MSRLPAPCHLITSQQAPFLPLMLSQHPSNKIIPLAKDRRTLCRLPLSSAPHKRQASFLCPLEALPVFLSSLSRGRLQVRPSVLGMALLCACLCWPGSSVLFRAHRRSSGCCSYHDLVRACVVPPVQYNVWNPGGPQPALSEGKRHERMFSHIIISSGCTVGYYRNIT